MKKLYIDDDLHKEFKLISVEEEIPMQVLTEKIVKEYLKKRKEKIKNEQRKKVSDKKKSFK